MIGWLADSLYSGVIGVWWIIQRAPWPTADDWFRWFLFLVLGKLVWFIVTSRFSPRRKRYTNRVSENGAAASISSLFEHH